MSDGTTLDRVARVAQKVRERNVRLGAALTEREVLDFERHHEISLPDGYRLFLMQVGNGGSGPPYYGLVPLGEWARDLSEVEAGMQSGLSHVRDPFPFTRTWVWEDGAMSDEGTIEQIRHGCIYLGTDGCGMDWYNIVTGPERGNVWMICGEGMQPTAPKRDFLQWYEDWLDGVREWWE